MWWQSGEQILGPLAARLAKFEPTLGERLEANLRATGVPLPIRQKYLDKKTYEAYQWRSGLRDFEEIAKQPRLQVGMKDQGKIKEKLMGMEEARARNMESPTSPVPFGYDPRQLARQADSLVDARLKSVSGFGPRFLLRQKMFGRLN